MRQQAVRVYICACEERGHHFISVQAHSWRTGESPNPPSMAVTGTDPIKIILAILLPPVGVFLEVGLSGQFWLNLLLTLLGYVPGIIHALYVILKY